MNTKNADTTPRNSCIDSNVETNLRKSFDVFSNLEVSFFNGVGKNPEGKRRLGDLFQSFVSDEYRTKIEYLRTLPVDEYKVKKTKLSGVTFSGIFTSRGNDHLESFTNLMCLDFDEIDNPEHFRDSLKVHPWIYASWVSPSGKGVKALVVIPSVDNDAGYKKVFKQVQKVFPSIDAACSDLSRLCFVSWDPGLWTNPNASVFELSFEHFEEVKPKQNFSSDDTPLNAFNRDVDFDPFISNYQWKLDHESGENKFYTRPGKDSGTSACWNEQKRLFYVFTSSTQLEASRAYSPAALYCFLECGGDFSETAKRLYAMGYGERHKAPSIPAGVNVGKETPPTATKNFKDYIIKDEPTEEIGIISINGVNVLSIGNVLLLTGPMKGRKTMLASILVNQCKLRTAYIDTEQGKKHSWRTGKFTPTADVFHLRGEDLQEITRVVNECVESGEYQLIVLDNVRDLVLDFNDVKESGRMELFLKKISERVPVIAILHENKNSQSGQGHVGHGLGKIAQTSIRVQLVDVEDPAKGSYVECVRSRDEPFKRAFISMDGILSGDNLLKAGGKTMLQDEFFRLLGDSEFTFDEMIERISEIFGIMKTSAKNSFYSIRKACPTAISERKEGKKKMYYVSLPSK